MTTKSKKFIWATASKKKELAERFKTSPSSVSLALRFKRNSPLALKIRDYAVNKLNCAPITLSPS